MHAMAQRAKLRAGGDASRRLDDAVRGPRNLTAPSRLEVAMLLFQKRFHQGLVEGTTTLTFRAWSKPQVKPMGRYRCHPIGVLEVSAIERVAVRDITEEDARRAGFEAREALVVYLGERSPVTDTSEVFRIVIAHVGDGDRVTVAMDDDLDLGALETLEKKLGAMDARSPRGAWTHATLAAIRARPKVAASQLALSFGCEKLIFKADVVKLKKLGLTQSFEVGYGLTPRGVAYSDWAEKKAKKKKARR